MRITRRLTLAIITAAIGATGVEAQTPAPVFTMSAYHRCDITRQTRADTLFRQVFAPALDKEVKAGRLTGYAFFSHRIGGGWRRLQSQSATSVANLMAAQDAVMADVSRTNPKGLAELNAICGSHDDYIWSRVNGSAPNPAAAPVPGGGYLYSRYFTCTDEAAADVVMAAAGAAVMNKHVTAGHMTGWSWLGHSVGGTVRRVLNWTGPDLMTALNASQQFGAELSADPRWAIFRAACNSHVDYVWHAEMTSP